MNGEDLKFYLSKIDETIKSIQTDIRRLSIVVTQQAVIENKLEEIVSDVKRVESQCNRRIDYIVKSVVGVFTTISVSLFLWKIGV